MNEGFGSLTGSVSESSDQFEILSGGGSFLLSNSQFRVVTVRFEPTAPGTHTCTIEAGSELCSDVSCTGVGILAPICSISPASINFDTVIVGDYRDLTFTVTNSGGGALSGIVSVPEACGTHYSIVSGGGGFNLAASQSLVVTVRFAPQSAGTHECTIETGTELCSDVSCTGVGILAPICSVSTSSIYFGTVYVGSTKGRTFTIKNTGSATLSGSVSDTCSAFSIVSGEGSFSLAASESLIVIVQFGPTAPGTYNCTIETGTELCNDVSCTGVSVPPPPDQQWPVVAFDGTNYLVVWQDYRSFDTWDIYGTRVSLGGVVLDPEGIAISTGVGDQGCPAVALDGTDYLVVWEDNRSGVAVDVYCARVSTEGSVLDPSGVIISAGIYGARHPSVAFDGTNYLVAWQNAFNIYGARVSTAGVVLDVSGIPICTASFNQNTPAVAFDGTNYLVVWADDRSHRGAHIYGARVGVDGSVLDASGIAISTGVMPQWEPDLAFDGTNYLVVWQESGGNFDYPDIYECPGECWRERA